MSVLDQLSNLTISDWGNLGQAITAVIAAAALYYAVRQVAEAKRQRAYQMTLHMLDMLSSSASRDLRYWIFNELPDSPAPAEMTAESWSKMEEVWTQFERVAYYVKLNLVDKDVVFGMYSGTIIPLFSRLKPYIEYEADLRGTRDIFLSDFRDLVVEANIYWTKTFPGTAVPTARKIPKGRS